MQQIHYTYKLTVDPRDGVGMKLYSRAQISVEYTFIFSGRKFVTFLEFTFMLEECSLVSQNKLSRFAIIWV